MTRQIGSATSTPCGPRLLAGDDGDAAMPERDDVLGRGAGTGAIVDVDAGRAGDRGLVDEDERQPAAVEPVQGRRVAVAGVDQRAVHRHVAGGHDRPPRPTRTAASAPARSGPAQRRSAPRKPVATSSVKAYGQRVGEQHADRAGGAAGERPRRRVGPDVAELVGGREDACRAARPRAGRGGRRRWTPSSG